MPFASFRSLLRNLFSRRQVDRELDDELRAYVDLIAAERVRCGEMPEAARRAAPLELGGVEGVKEEVRDTRSGATLDIMMRDVRFAARSLLKTPAFTAA